MLEPGQAFRHIDEITGRELIVYAQADGSATVNVYQKATRMTTQYSVDLPREQLTALALALAAHAHPESDDA